MFKDKSLHCILRVNPAFPYFQQALFIEVNPAVQNGIQIIKIALLDPEKSEFKDIWVEKSVTYP